MNYINDINAFKTQLQQTEPGLMFNSCLTKVTFMVHQCNFMDPDLANHFFVKIVGQTIFNAETGPSDRLSHFASLYVYYNTPQDNTEKKWELCICYGKQLASYWSGGDTVQYAQNVATETLKVIRVLDAYHRNHNTIAPHAQIHS